MNVINVAQWVDAASVEELIHMLHLVAFVCILSPLNERVGLGREENVVMGKHKGANFTF